MFGKAANTVSVQGDKNSAWLWCIFGAKFLGGIIVAIGFALYFNQDKILYIPNPPGFPKTVDENPPFWRSPGEWTVKGHPRKLDTSAQPIPFENLHIKTIDGETIHCWLMLQPQISNNVPTLVYFHGNAGNMGFRLKNAAEMYARVGINIMMVDYRGYGSSTGHPTEDGINKDGDAVLNYLLHNKMIKGSPIVLFGRSLGGAVAISLANRHPNDVHGVIVENTFLSVSAMVDKLMPVINILKPLILRIKWDNEDKIQRIKQPIMFISGDSDELVPPFHMKNLFNLATDSVHRDFYSVSGGKHNDTWDIGGTQYYERLSDFFAKVVEFTSGKKSSSSGNSDSKFHKVNQAEDGDIDVLPNMLPTMTTNFHVKSS